MVFKAVLFGRSTELFFFCDVQPQNKSITSNFVLVIFLKRLDQFWLSQIVFAGTKLSSAKYTHSYLIKSINSIKR